MLFGFRLLQQQIPKLRQVGSLQLYFHIADMYGNDAPAHAAGSSNRFYCKALHQQATNDHFIFYQFFIPEFHPFIFRRRLLSVIKLDFDENETYTPLRVIWGYTFLRRGGRNESDEQEEMRMMSKDF
jgi:hypothetical protein